MAKLRTGSHRWTIVLLSTLGVVIAAASAWQSWQPTLLANFYRDKLQQARDEKEIAGCLHQLLKLGDVGLPAAIDALAATSEPLSGQARTQLLAEVQRWETLSAETSSAHLAALAHLLASRVDRSPASVRRFAAELASHILALPAERMASQRSSLLVYCKELLKASPPDDNQPTMKMATGSEKVESITTSKPFTTTSAEPLRLERVSRLPGGGLPIEVASVDPADSSAAGFSEPRGGKDSKKHAGDGIAAGSKTLPGRLPDSGDAHPIAAAFSSRDDLVFAKQGDKTSTTVASENTIPAMNSAASVLSSLRSPLSQDLTKLPAREVIAALTGADDAQCLKIQAELTRRGFTAIDLALARRLADVDIQRRKELTNLLPSLPGVDAKPWLLWLGHDESLEVRLAAATVMATSDDPEMLAWVRELANSDSQIAARVKLR